MLEALSELEAVAVRLCTLHGPSTAPSGGRPVQRNRDSRSGRRVRDQPGRLQASAADHRLIVEGLLRNDSEQAAHAMRGHISAKGRAYADLLLAQPPKRAGSAP